MRLMVGNIHQAAILGMVLMHMFYTQTLVMTLMRARVGRQESAITMPTLMIGSQAATSMVVVMKMKKYLTSAEIVMWLGSTWSTSGHPMETTATGISSYRPSSSCVMKTGTSY